MVRIVVTLALSSLAGCGVSEPIPAAPTSPAATLAGGVERRDLRFACGDGTCAAWLFLPAGATRPPVVVMGHGFAGTRDVGLPYFAETFAGRGVAALVFDYRHFGASSGAPRQLVDPALQIEDWRAALAFVRDLEDVDGTRAALWGTSMGGGHALVAAAGDPGLRAVVVQVPLVDPAREGEADFPGIFWAARLVLTGWADLLSERLGLGSIEIAAIAPNGGFGMIVDDRAFAAFERLVPAGSTYRNAIVAHSPFTFDDYDPSRDAAALRVPLLLIASPADRFAPFAAVEHLASALPNAELEKLEGDHFDVYSPPVRDRAADLAADFLVEHLGPRS